MDENRVLSRASYGIASGEIKKGQIIKDTHHLVLDVVNTDKQTVGEGLVKKIVCRQ